MLVLGAALACTSDRPQPTAPRLSPVPPHRTLAPVSGVGFTAVSAGGNHSCGLLADGTVACWGNNDDGRATPPTGRFTAVGAGNGHTCGVGADGTLACWGRNLEGQASPPTGRFTAVSAGNLYTCGLQADGTVACWGDNSYGQATPPAGRFTAVSAGYAHTCGVQADGTIACWGRNLYGEGTPPTGPFTAVSAGANHTCGVRADGTTACWGGNGYGESTPPVGHFTNVSAGYAHSCGLQADGTIACWGDNSFGQATPSAGRFRAVSAGYYHTCGVRDDGTVSCWGKNGDGQATPPVVTSNIDLAPATDTKTVGASELFTATAKVGGAPVAGKTVTFTIVDGPDAGMAGTGTTDASGVARFSVTGTSPGTDGVRASFVDAYGATQTSSRVALTFVALPTNNPPFVTGLHQYPSAMPLSVGTKTCGPTRGRFTACIQFAANDPDPEGTFQAVVAWGDGTMIGPYSGLKNSVSMVSGHNYTSPGTYTITITTLDVLGAADRKTLTLTVAP